MQRGIGLEGHPAQADIHFQGSPLAIVDDPNVQRIGDLFQGFEIWTVLVYDGCPSTVLLLQVSV